MRYRLSVYLSISLLTIVAAAVAGRYDLIPLFIGMYLPVAILTEVGMVRIISRHGGVENARRRGFPGRIAVYLLEAACWVVVALLLGRTELISIILGLLLPLLVVFDLLFIYRVLSRNRSSIPETGVTP